MRLLSVFLLVIMMNHPLVEGTDCCSVTSARALSSPSRGPHNKPRPWEATRLLRHWCWNNQEQLLLVRIGPGLFRPTTVLCNRGKPNYEGDFFWVNGPLNPAGS